MFGYLTGIFFCRNIFNADIAITTYTISAYENSKNEHLQTFNVDDVQGNEQVEVLTMRQNLPAQFSLHETLEFSQHVWFALVQVLKEPNKYVEMVGQFEDTITSFNSCSSCCKAITFTDDDL